MTQAELHIASWNADGLRRLLASGPSELITVVAELGGPDVVCVQEVAIRPDDVDLMERLDKALPGYTCGASLCRDPINVKFRGGRAYGVATYASERIGPADAYTFGWDREGRVLVTELSNSGLAIVNVYAVNGTSRPYFDEEGVVLGDRHAWKRRFIQLLSNECRGLLGRGFELVLVGDWNVSRTKLDTYPRLRTEEPHATARAAFNDEFIPSLGLVDIYRRLHPEERKYTWFSRRARAPRLDAARVDFALVSESIAARVTAADIDDTAAHRFGSDHAPLFLRIAPR